MIIASRDAARRDLDVRINCQMAGLVVKTRTVFQGGVINFFRAKTSWVRVNIVGTMTTVSQIDVCGIGGLAFIHVPEERGSKIRSLVNHIKCYISHSMRTLKRLFCCAVF